MNLGSRWKSLKAALFSRQAADHEMDNEFRDHLARRVETLRREGAPADEAERRARVEFGGVEKYKEECREERGGFWLDALRSDVVYGLRMMGKNPGFAFIAVLTIALGIGANTSVFSAMNAVMLQNLPVPHPEQVYHLILPDGQPDGDYNTGNSDTSFSMAAYQAMRGDTQVFRDLVAFVPLSGSKSPVRIGEIPEEAMVEMVSGNFFSGLQVRMARGRGFSADDERTHAQVAVISNAFWTTRFGKNPSALGATMFVKGVPFTVVGIAPAEFWGLEPGVPTDVYIPLQDRPDLTAWGTSATQLTMYGSPKWWCIRLTGRLQPGVEPAQAVARLTPAFQGAVLQGLGTPGPKFQMPKLTLESAHGIQGYKDAFQQPITVLMAMVVLVLAIACGNVAMLLLARNSARQREFAMRIALGAGRARLARQLLTESLLLVGMGAGLGWLFAIVGSRALSAWAGFEVPFELSTNVLLFTLGISVVCALVFGLAPLRSVVRTPAGLALRGTNAAPNSDKRTAWGGKLVVAAQMTVCLVLLVGAGLLVKSLQNYQNMPLGLRADGLLVFGTSPLNANTTAERATFYQRLLEKMRTLPGVESATLVSNRPGSGWSDNDWFKVDGVLPTGSFEEFGARSNDVGPDFFHTMGIPIRQGRDIDDADRAGAPKVAVVNETFVKTFFPKGEALGHTLSPGLKDEKISIVGVVGDSKYTRVGEKARSMVYLPYAQSDGIGNMHVELRTEGDPEALLPSVRTALRDINPDLPVQKPMTQRAQFEDSYAQARMFARLSLFFGGVAVLLVATGLYGTLAYRVSRRTPEIGVRMALGAQRAQVLWMVLRESLILCAIAVLAGVPLALAGARGMQSMLFGVGPSDGLSVALALLGVIAVSLVASFLPARRASRVDPMVALRYD